MPNFAPATAEGVFSSSGAKTIAEEIIADIELAWKEILYIPLFLKEGPPSLLIQGT